MTGNERYFPSYKGRSHYLEKPSVVRAAARFDIVVKHLLHKNLLLAGGKSKTDSRKKLRQLGYFGFPRPLNKFSAYKKLASITVGYLDLETMNIVNTQMYIDGYQVKLVSDTSYGSLWEVSFTLKEF